MAKSVCFYSLVLVFVLVTALNLYLLNTLDNSTNTKNLKEMVTISFSHLPSDYTGHYRIWSLSKSSRKRSQNSQDVSEKFPVDVTIATQTSVSNLADVAKLMESWAGRVSVAVFAPGGDVEYALGYIETMQVCEARIRELVDFHLVMVSSHPPTHDNLAYYWKKVQMHPRVCGPFPLNADSSKKASVRNYANKRIPYPVNVLRNVALQAVETSHLLVIDVDMIPSPNLLLDFQKHFTSIKRSKAVYVLPTFELKVDQSLPRSKEELLKIWMDSRARPFYEKVCWKCQRYTDYDKWRRSKSAEISIAYKVDWQDPWEPFFIAETKSVVYDERFKQYGFNRISQVCETHFSGNSFYVLDNAFLIHRGFKEPKQFHKTKDVENARNRILYRTFKKELKQKYPDSTRHC